MKLRSKILLITMIPAILVGVLAISTSSNMIRKQVTEEIEQQLKTAAMAGIESYEFANDEQYVRTEDGKVTKGNIILSENNEIVDNIYKSGEIHASVFFGDERIVSTIKDENGQRVIGTKAPEDVVKKVLTQGKEYFTQDVVINGQQYYAYYIPMKQVGTDEIIGMFVAADTKAQVNQIINDTIIKIGIIVLIIVILSILASILSIRSLTNAIGRNVQNLNKLSEGFLNYEETEKDLKRKDEIGNIAHATKNLKNSLIQVIQGIHENASVLLSASEELEQVAEQTATTTEGIERAVDDIAAGAMSQAESTEEASRQTIIMGEDIETTSIAVNQLHQNADKMKESSIDAMKTLEDLNSTNEKTKKEINAIFNQTNETNEFAQKIKEAAFVITSIAEETNLLSLNASIEAARAGESGRGFAVVADQIKKLAEQSSMSAKEIGIIIHTLIGNSNRAVEIMHEVKSVIDIQNDNLSKTKDNFVVVFEGINHSSDQIDQIAQITKELNSVRKNVIDIISNLSAISEENAASAEETSASTTQLSASVNDVGSEVAVLRQLADELVKTISIFKL